METAIHRLSQRRRVIVKATLFPIALALSVLAVCLCADAYSVWRASEFVKRLERIRIGMPQSELAAACSGYDIQLSGSDLVCGTAAWHSRYSSLRWLLARLLDESRRRAGLREWDVIAVANVSDGVIRELDLRLYVESRHEALGAEWRLAGNIEPEFLKPTRGGESSPPTYLVHWFHISDGLRGGEGITVDATPGSTEREIASRRINWRCLVTFSGCSGLCELMPDAFQIRKERDYPFGACCGIPRAACDTGPNICDKQVSKN